MRGLFEKSKIITRVLDRVNTRKKSTEIVSSDRLFLASDTLLRIKGSEVDRAFPKWWSYWSYWDWGRDYVFCRLEEPSTSSISSMTLLNSYSPNILPSMRSSPFFAYFPLFLLAPLFNHAWNTFAPNESLSLQSFKFKFYRSEEVLMYFCNDSTFISSKR